MGTGLNDGAMLGAAAITGLAVWEVQRAYASVAPSIKDLRKSCCDNTENRQVLLDTNVYIGGLALLAGITAGWLSRSWVPVLVLAGATMWASYYHHSVLAGVTPDDIDRSF